MSLRLPNFICAGAQKSGTTTLYEILKQHPQIFLPWQKEVSFFHIDQNYRKGKEFYASFYKNCRMEKLLGDISPAYMYYENVPSRIYNTLGKDIKLIFMLRNPVERAYSSYLMAYRRGYEDKSFLEAIEIEEDRISQDDFSKLHFSYIDRGFYAKQIKRYLKYFSSQQMFFIIFEKDFIASEARRSTINKLLNFLEIEVFPLETNIKANPSSQYRNKFLQQLFNNPERYRSLREFAKTLIPNAYLRQRLLKRFESIALIPLQKSDLDIELKKDLLKRYFYRDIMQLQEILDRNLDFWFNEP